MTQSRAPLIVAIVLLLLPVLYVGSYLALVVPEGVSIDAWLVQYRRGQRTACPSYRYHANFCSVLFWPLEQLDRNVRPDEWITPETS